MEVGCAAPGTNVMEIDMLDNATLGSVGESSVTLATGVATKAPATTALSLRDVAVSFNQRTAVRGATFDIAQNRVTSLIGPSGSGKTTLLRALNRLHDRTPSARVTGEI